MCAGIALALSELPVDFVRDNLLRARLHTRGDEPELRFLYRDVPRLLPIFHEGRIRLVRWGTRRNESKVLPPTGWTWQASVESGVWGDAELTPVIIPATSGVEKGIWFRIRQGIRGLLVKDEGGADVVYMLCEPSSHYYSVMTRSNRMPALVEERY